MIFVLLIFITIPFQTAVPGRPVFHINVLPAALVYMLLGYGIHMLIDVKSNKIHISHGILLIFVGWRMSNTYGGAISQIGNLCYFFESFCTIIGILILVTRAKKILFLEYIGERSLFIMGLHALVFQWATEFTDYIKQGVGFNSDFIYHILMVGVTIIICCSIADAYYVVKDMICRQLMQGEKQHESE